MGPGKKSVQMLQTAKCNFAAGFEKLPAAFSCLSRLTSNLALRLGRRVSEGFRDAPFVFFRTYNFRTFAQHFTPVI